MLFCRGIEVRTHVLYVDNILIFCNGSLSNFRCLLDIFNAYALVSSQVCLAQLRARFSQDLSPVEGRLLNISALLGFHVGTFPFTYPRFPIFVGQPKVLYLQAIVDKIKA
jgi:hypothetical protein